MCDGIKAFSSIEMMSEDIIALYRSSKQLKNKNKNKNKNTIVKAKVKAH